MHTRRVQEVAKSIYRYSVLEALVLVVPSNAKKSRLETRSEVRDRPAGGAAIGNHLSYDTCDVHKCTDSTYTEFLNQQSEIRTSNARRV
jgi:hypothetical protein